MKSYIYMIFFLSLSLYGLSNIWLGDNPVAVPCNVYLPQFRINSLNERIPRDHKVIFHLGPHSYAVPYSYSPMSADKINCAHRDEMRFSFNMKPLSSEGLPNSNTHESESSVSTDKRMKDLKDNSTQDEVYVKAEYIGNRNPLEGDRVRKRIEYMTANYVQSNIVESGTSFRRLKGKNDSKNNQIYFVSWSDEQKVLLDCDYLEKDMLICLMRIDYTNLQIEATVMPRRDSLKNFDKIAQEIPKFIQKWQKNP